MKTVNGFLYVGERLTPSVAQFKAPISAAGHLDLGRMAVAGHSMGGLAAALTIEHDLSFKAGVISLMCTTVMFQPR